MDQKHHAIHANPRGCGIAQMLIASLVTNGAMYRPWHSEGMAMSLLGRRMKVKHMLGQRTKAKHTHAEEAVQKG